MRGETYGRDLESRCRCPPEVASALRGLTGRASAGIGYLIGTVGRRLFAAG